MKIVYRPHLTRRLQERNIPISYPKKIFQAREEEYFDTITKHRIAIKKLFYAGRLRNMAISYDIIGESAEIITIHPIKQSEIQNKIEVGRWEEYEEN